MEDIAPNASPSADPSPATLPDGFPVTHWTVVLAARGADEPAARRAMGQLFQDYWYPLYAYARRRGLSPHDAEDRTQDFFRALIENNSLLQVEPERGRLRAYFLASMKNFIGREFEKQATEKRGGGLEIVSIDHEMAEQRLASEPTHDRSPDALFDQSWAYAVLDRALKRLEAWYGGMKRRDLFAEIRGFLTGSGDSGYRAVAQRLKVSETALRAAIVQMRKRYRVMIEDEIHATVSCAEEAAEELAHLQKVLAGE